MKTNDLIKVQFISIEHNLPALRMYMHVFLSTLYLYLSIFWVFHLTSVLTISKFQMSHGDHYIVTTVTIPPFEILGMFFSHLFFCIFFFHPTSVLTVSVFQLKLTCWS